MMKIVFAMLVLGLGIFGSDQGVIGPFQKPKIRVINRSPENFTDVMLFSMKFQDLKPGDTSEYQELDFNPLADDPLIYCAIGDENYARYLKIPEAGIKSYSYLIDSIQNGILYVSSAPEIK